MNSPVDPMYELYLKEHYRHQSLHEKNLINQENAMITLSIALLASLTALGDKLILADKTLAIITIIFKSITIMQVVVGYMFSNAFFVRIKSKLRENYTKYQTDKAVDLGDGVSDGPAGKINDILNMSTPVTFLLSLVFFLALVIIYAGGLQ